MAGDPGGLVAKLLERARWVWCILTHGHIRYPGGSHCWDYQCLDCGREWTVFDD